jgi:hypothetical protein
MVDSASKIILEQVIKKIDYHGHIQSQQEKFFHIPFELYGTDKHAQYAVSVHIDMDGDNTVSLGDYINRESYPVITHGNANEVSVKVRQIH